MKIRSQDGNSLFEFGSVFISEVGLCNEILIYSEAGQRSFLLGRYENYLRTQSVLAEIEIAYMKDEKVFYMPEE